MANRERGEMRLEVDGRTYTLVLTLNAMCDVEEAMSTPDKEFVFQDLMARLSKNRMTDFRLFIWACLREHHAEITIPQVGQLIQDAGGVVAFTRRISTLFASASPDPEDLKEAGVKADDEARPRKAQLGVVGTGAALSSRRSASA